MAHLLEYNLDIGQTKPDNVHRQEDYCPFCDVEHLTNVMETRGHMIWLENKYPVLKDCWQTIIIETDDCNGDFAKYPADQALDLIRFGLEKWQQVKDMGRFQSVVFYRNHGFMSGGTIRHPHSQIVGFEDYDYHDDISAANLQGHEVLSSTAMNINVSEMPNIGFYEFNLILKDREQLAPFVHHMQQTADFMVNKFVHHNESYNIFFYDFPGDDNLYVKMVPRFLTNPLYVGYKIIQVANVEHRNHVIEEYKKALRG